MTATTEITIKEETIFELAASNEQAQELRKIIAMVLERQANPRERVEMPTATGADDTSDIAYLEELLG